MRPNVHHVVRPKHSKWCPVHVTLRRAKGLPSFRTELLHCLMKRAIADSQREGFRIVEYSVQADHVHLVIEAESGSALTSGMRSFAVRVAMRVNSRVLRRHRGRVWGDRYHRRDLTSARQVRNALVYCLQNYKKHQRVTSGAPRIDLCSSARWFQGWTAIRQHDDGPRPTEQAHTVLLRTAWQKHGFIHPGEAPRTPN